MQSWIDGQPVALFVFYRALMVAGTLAAVDAMVAALERRGFNVAPAHVRVAAEAAGSEQDTLARLDIQGCAVAGNARADDAAVVDDQVLHCGVGPDRRLATQVDQRLEHLTDE